MNHDSHRAILSFFILSISILLPGCMNGSNNSDPITAIEETPKGIAGGLDPTGSINEIQDRRQMWQRIEKTIREFDVQGLNDAMGQLFDLMEALSARIKVWHENDLAQLRDNTNATLAAIREQVNEAEFDKLILDTREDINSLHDQIQQLLESVQAMVSEIQPAEARRILNETNVILEKFQTTQQNIEDRLIPLLTETHHLIEETRTTVQQLPIDTLDSALLSISDSTAQWPDASAAILKAAHSLDRAIYLAMGILLLVGISVLVRLVYFLKKHKGKDHS